METELLKGFMAFVIIALIISPISLMAREKEEDMGKPFSLNLVNKLNLIGKVFILPIVVIWDFIGLVGAIIIASIIHLSIFIFGKKEVKKEVA